MKNFEPARSAAPALGCLRRRSALSNTGILRDGSLWRPRNADRPDSARGRPFRRHPAWLSSARARLTSPAGRRHGRRVTLRPTQTPAPSLRRRLLPAAATCMRTARRPHDDPSSASSETVSMGGQPCVGDGRRTGLTPPVPAKRSPLGPRDHLESKGRP